MGFLHGDQSIRFLSDLLAEQSCSDPKLPCIRSDMIRIPLVSDHSLSIFDNHFELPFKHQNLSEIQLLMVLNADETVNVDLKDDSFSKLRNSELEIYGEECISFIRFDLSEVTGTVVSLKLFLHVVWVSDADGNSLSEDRLNGFGMIAFVRKTKWEAPMRYETHPYYNWKHAITYSWSKENCIFFFWFLWNFCGRHAHFNRFFKSY